jgi:predicted porin
MTSNITAFPDNQQRKTRPFPFGGAGAAALLLAAASTAQAQSGVTIYGMVDASVLHAKGSLASKTQLFSGSSLGTRLGFRGVEDLGGGMAANFVLESGFGLDSGVGQATNTNNQTTGAASAAGGGQGLTFNRLSYVGLSGSWGELRLGRDYTPAWRAMSSMDPAAIGTGLWSAQSALGSLVVLGQPAGIRASNSVGYYTPVIGGFTGQIMVALGENASNVGATKSDGNVIGGRIAYNAGAFSMVAATEKIKMAAQGDVRESVIGASYNFGPAKLWAQYVRDTTGLSNNMSGHSLSVSAPVGASELRAQWSRSKVENAAGAAIGTVNKIAVYGQYNLSKRTGLYTTLARVRNSDGASSVPFVGVAVTGPNTSATAMEVGMRHAF